MAEFAMGYNAYMGVGVQSTLSTSVAATKFQKVTKLGMKPNKPNRRPLAANIGGVRGYTSSIKGKSSVEGSNEGPLCPDEIYGGIGWAFLFGSNNSVTGSATVGYTHTFSEPTAAAHYPAAGATIEERKGSTTATLMADYVGCFLKALELNFPEDGEVTWTDTWVGVSEATGGSMSVASYSSLNAYEASMVDIQIGASLSATSAVDYTSGKWSYDNGVKMMTGGKNSTPNARSYPGIPNCTLEFTENLKEDLTLYNYWKNDTTVAAKIVITHTQLAGSSSGVHTITINMPAMIFLGNPPEISGQDEQPVTYSLQAMRDAALSYTCQPVLLNSESGTYSV